VVNTCPWIDFRFGFDTLGEVTVWAIAGVAISTALIDGLRLRIPEKPMAFGRPWNERRPIRSC